jgi:hypothetical protein
MAALVVELIDRAVARLVIESRESQDGRDRRVIAGVVTKMSAELSYVHVPPHTEPGLWWPDAIAWAYGAGGRWRAMVESRVCATIDVGQV